MGTIQALVHSGFAKEAHFLSGSRYPLYILYIARRVRAED
jgi:hypothetical protein